MPYAAAPAKANNLATPAVERHVKNKNIIKTLKLQDTEINFLKNMA